MESNIKIKRKIDVDEKELENKQFTMEFEAKLDMNLKRENSYEEILNEAFAEIWERCSIGVKDKLESRSDFESNVFNDPTNFLETIK